MVRGRWIASGAAAAVLTLATHAGAQETHRLSGPDAAVYNLAGRARIVRGAGPDVVVRVTRGGSDAERLEVVSGPLDGRATLRVLYPGDEVVYPAMGRGSNNTMRVRGDGTFGGGRGSGGRVVRVRGSGSGVEAWADLVVEVPRGGTLTLAVSAGAVEARDVEGDVEIDTGSGRVDASGVRGALSVDTGSGAVVARGVSGPLSVDTGSGSVELDDVSGDEIFVDTGSGRVSGARLRGTRLRVDTGSGSIGLDGVEADDVVLDTGSGSVEVTLSAGVGRLDVDTGSGSVTVRAPDSIGADVELETGSGGIEVEFPVEVSSARRNRLHGRIGAGGGRIHVETGSGTIRFLRR